MHLQTVIDLIAKQKIVEGMVRGQSNRRQDLVETIVHNQHATELKRLVGQLSTVEIGIILTSLPLDDARIVWRLVGKEREDDVLWELREDLREALAGPRDPECNRGRITAYELRGGRIQVVAIRSAKDFEGIQPIWIDLLAPSKPERGWIGARFGIDLPDPDELTDLEASARFYVDDGDEVHLHSNFLLDREGDSRSVAVAFVIRSEILFTVRNDELPVFRLQRLRARNTPGLVSNCRDMLLDLYAADVEYSADALEDAYLALRQVGDKVLSASVSDTDAARILADIAEEEDLNGRIRSNMLDTQRAVSFLIRGRILSPTQVDEAREILRDIESLNSHTAYLFDKINFLMDASVGFVNVNQNKRVTQLTVISIVFMPINVLAGVGGMSEFSMMTQAVPWPVAYGAFLIAMVLVGIGTYLMLHYFDKRKTRDLAAARKLRLFAGHPQKEE
jgi:magnesium transporter